jgi:RNA polymerase sigma-B factor
MENEDKLWADYLQNKSAENRNKLFEKYFYLAEIAAKKYSKKHQKYDYYEILSYASDGLIYAIGKYDPTKNNNFCAFAHQRVHGAIIDVVRSNAGRRYDYVQSDKIAKRKFQLEQIKQSAVTDDDVMLDMGFTAKKFNAHTAIISSTDDIIDDVKIGDTLAAKTDTGMQNLETTDCLETILTGLEPLEHDIIWLKYVDGYTQLEISVMAGISQSYVSIILIGAMQKIRNRMFADSKYANTLLQNRSN